MIRKCISILTIQGTYEKAERFYQAAAGEFCNGILLNDAFGDTKKYLYTVTIYSYLQMPKLELLNITRSLTKTSGLIVRIASQELWEDYSENAVFKNGKWSFAASPDEEKQFALINQKGWEEVKQQIAASGKLNFTDWGWPIKYIDQKSGYIIGTIKTIQLLPDGNLSIVLVNKTQLTDNDLCTSDIVSLLNLIERKTKNKKR